MCPKVYYRAPQKVDSVPELGQPPVARMAKQPTGFFAGMAVVNTKKSTFGLIGSNATNGALASLRCKYIFVLGLGQAILPSPAVATVIFPAILSIPVGLGCANNGKIFLSPPFHTIPTTWISTVFPLFAPIEGVNALGAMAGDTGLFHAPSIAQETLKTHARTAEV